MKDLLITGSSGFVGTNLLKYFKGLNISILTVDSVLTIQYRIKNGENILEAHRSHLYQYLANEMKWSHLIVAFIYS